MVRRAESLEFWIFINKVFFCNIQVKNNEIPKSRGCREERELRSSLDIENDKILGFLGSRG